jgi:hypothetical protein
MSGECGGPLDPELGASPCLPPPLRSQHTCTITNTIVTTTTSTFINTTTTTTTTTATANINLRPRSGAGGGCLYARVPATEGGGAQDGVGACGPGRYTYLGHQHNTSTTLAQH